jgi:Ca-activated chloride channel family protein
MPRRRSLSRAALLAAATLALATLPAPARGGGVLIPSTAADEPDPAVLAMRSLSVRVTIDGPHAEVRIEQVFENKTDEPLEGRYEFPLGPTARVKAFSIWEGAERLHGVVVEKQRGRRLYEDLTRQALDPGLAESGDEHAGNTFSLRVSPIPPHGTTRVLFVYDEDLGLASLASQLVVPLAARGHEPQPVGALDVRVDVRSPWSLAGARLAPEAWFPGARPTAGGRELAAAWRGTDVTLDRDLVIQLAHAPPPGNTPALTALWTFRDPTPFRDLSPLAGGPTMIVDAHGYFAVRAALPPRAPGGKRPPRDLVFVLDASLSMQGEELDAAWAALAYGIGDRLGPDDRFGVVLMNDRAQRFSAALVPADEKQRAAALAWVRGSYLAGGTDVVGGVDAAAALLAATPRDGAERAIVLITDGQPTSGTVNERPVREAVARAMGTLPGARLHVLGVGDEDADLLLAALATTTGGAYQRLAAWEGDAAELARRTFFDRVDGRALEGLTLALPPGAGVTDIYGPTLFWPGGDALIFGRYQTPAASAPAELTARAPDGTATKIPFTAALPARDTAHPWVARGWAARRVRDLVERIRLDGERPEWVAEVVALGKRFALVTPYTSFIAAPRALLRPRNFQAGDPILRVKTGPEIREVVAIFPWGLTKSLERVPDENVWETRFLAPAWTKDGTYRCTLILTDDAGRKLREDKRFTVDSQAPRVEVALDRGVARPGERVRVTVRADQDVRRIRARLDEGPEVEVRWDRDARASLGELELPPDLAAGPHRIHVVAEDFALNTTMATVELGVIAPPAAEELP